MMRSIGTVEAQSASEEKLIMIRIVVKRKTIITGRFAMTEMHFPF
jgi:hypothetical protein